MLQSGFVVAMKGDLSLGQYDRPTALLHTAPFWLIVSRWGRDGEFLTISSADRALPDSIDAPAGLAPRNTLFGLMLSEDEEQFEATFLLVRRLPPRVSVAGTFFPADGYARLHNAVEDLRLTSEGRHAHSRGSRDGEVVRKDVPDPAPDAPGTLSWHISACRRRWDGEFIGRQIPNYVPLSQRLGVHVA